jgi:hypothetical protein
MTKTDAWVAALLVVCGVTNMINGRVDHILWVFALGVVFLVAGVRFAIDVASASRNERE